MVLNRHLYALCPIPVRHLAQGPELVSSRLLISHFAMPGGGLALLLFQQRQRHSSYLDYPMSEKNIYNAFAVVVEREVFDRMHSTWYKTYNHIV
ncbi:hypothetical protein QQP08_008205 [Theobroma cacao]|nr:hypothetical protein QQP08_008205 [Theobroma cacao]